MKSYADKYKADVALYKDVEILHLGLSVRAFNCLHSKGVKTVAELLHLSDDDIVSLRNAGKTTVADINKCISDFVGKYPSEVPAFPKPVGISSGKKIRIGDMLHVESKYYATASVRALQLQSRYEEALLNAGYSTVLQLLNATPSDLSKIKTFGKKKLDLVVKKLSEFTTNKAGDSAIKVDLNLRVQPFIIAYRKTNVFSSSNPLNYFDNSITFASFGDKVPKDILNEQDRFEIDNFRNWLSSDMDEIVSSWENLPKVMGARGIGVLNGRIKGSTLEEIGSMANCTRERIRQIEEKALATFVREYNSLKYDLVLYCSALENGKRFISRKSLDNYLDRKTVDLLWYSIREKSNEIGGGVFEYSALGDCVVVGEKAADFEDKLKRILQRVTGGMHETDLKPLVIQTSNLCGIPEDVIWAAIQKNLHKYGYIYSSTFMDKKDKVAYILKHYFLNGYKVSQKHDYEMMTDYLRRLFDETKETSLHAVDTLVQRAGILVNRGLYMHPDYIEASENTLHLLSAYIRDNQKEMIFFGDMYNDLRSVLDEVGITNRYILKGILEKYGCEYGMNRDFIIRHVGM